MPEYRYIGLQRLEAEAKLAIREALTVEGAELEHDVKHTMPHLTEDMDASTDIGPITGGGNAMTRKLTVAEPYSIFEHEKLWYEHDDGQAKFVKFPLLRAMPRLRARLGAAVARRF
jgi:hypothetical protein